MPVRHLHAEIERKRRFYDRPAFAARYYWSQHLNGGRDVVFQREVEILRGLIPPGSGGPVVDIATGNGRLLPVLVSLGYRPVGLDLSPAMMAQARDSAARFVCGDAALAPVRSRACAGILAHRFAYHYSSIDPFLDEFARILQPGGWLCFDVLNWTPSTLAHRIGFSAGSLVYAHRRARLLESFCRAGFTTISTTDAFLVNPAWVRFLPSPLTRLLISAGGSGALPSAKTYWLLRTV